MSSSAQHAGVRGVRLNVAADGLGCESRSLSTVRTRPLALTPHGTGGGP